MDKTEYQKMYDFEDCYWWYRGLHELVRHFVENKGAQGPSQVSPMRILDAGCGTGRLVELLAPFGTVEGFDYSEEALELCRKRGLRSVRREDLNAWQPPSAAYDVVISNDVICTSGIDDDMAAIRKFRAALKPGGMLIMNLPAFALLRRRHDIAVSGKRRYSRTATVAAVRGAGFVPVCVSYRLPLLFLFILFQKYVVEPFRKADIVTSDLKSLPATVNSLLLTMNRIENRMIKAGIVMPFGSSLFLACRAL